MASLKMVRILADTFGASVEDDKIGNTHECRCEAPHGKVWACDGLHEIISCTNRPWKPDYADLLERMAYGIEVCPSGLDCEWCHPSES